MIKESPTLGTFEEYLAVWVALCMLLGLFLSQYFPTLSVVINNLQIAGISIPIGICLFHACMHASNVKEHKTSILKRRGLEDA